MRVVILLSVLLLAVSVNSKTGFYHSPSLNCSFEYPLEWQIDTSQANSIVIKENDAINIKIIKHYLGDDEIMRSESDLYEGITGLYNDLGIVINEDDDINYQVFDGYAEFDINFIPIGKHFIHDQQVLDLACTGVVTILGQQWFRKQRYDSVLQAQEYLQEDEIIVESRTAVFICTPCQS